MSLNIRSILVWSITFIILHQRYRAHTDYGPLIPFLCVQTIYQVVMFLSETKSFDILIGSVKTCMVSMKASYTPPQPV